MIQQRETMVVDLSRNVLSPHEMVSDRYELLTYARDAGPDVGNPAAVAFPDSAQALVRLVQWAKAHDVPLIARGAGTGLSGGAVAERGGVIVEFSRMNTILELDTGGRAAVVQPGVVNQALDERASTCGLYYPPDPASGGCATIGGNIAENAGGPHCLKYGVTANYVTGLEVVLADGRTVHLGGRALDFPGYDLVGLITGSEGTLALITAAELRLIGRPPAVQTLMAAFASVEAAGCAVTAVIAHGLVPSTLELMDQQAMQVIESYRPTGLPVSAGAGLIVEVDGRSEGVADELAEVAAVLKVQGALELRVAEDASERAQLWMGRKTAPAAFAHLAARFTMLDGCVPRSRLASTLATIDGICARHGLRSCHLLHAGDGNLHPDLLCMEADEDAAARLTAAADEVMTLLVAQGGSITGEHGVGIEKRRYMPLMYSRDELDVMRGIKEVFDPQGLLNPGKMLPEQSISSEKAEPEPTSALSVPDGELMIPDSVAEAAAAVRAWATEAQRRGLRVRGGGTKSGHLQPAPCSLSTGRLLGVLDYVRENLCVSVGAGTPLAEVQAILAADGLWVPLLTPWPASTIGGIVSANVNAPLRMKYGALRDLVLALTAVLPDGKVVRFGRPVVKNVAGYDMVKLFVGAQGTLGLITDVTVRVAALPRARGTLLASTPDIQQALACGTRLLGACISASALLLCRGCGLGERDGEFVLALTAEGTAGEVRAELDAARSICGHEGLSDLREVAGLAGSEIWANWVGRYCDAPLARVGTPVSRLGSILQSALPDLATAPFVADIANGLWYGNSVLAAPMRTAAAAAGGYAVIWHATTPLVDTWTDHGDGAELMRRLKHRWDPEGLFNPGAM